MPLRSDIRKVLVIGSGPIVIGQAAEFDYAGTQACIALKEEGIEVVLLNNNPATIMTDPTFADKVYMEPLTVETLEEIIRKERPDGIIGTLGGQTGLNLAVALAEKGILEQYGVELLGTSVESIKKGEDRELFRNLMLEIGEPVPESKIVHSVEEGFRFVREIGYPVIIRPAYTLGGAGGGFAHDDEELEMVLKNGLNMSPIHQCLVEKSIKGWKEIEYEVMRDANDTCIIVCNMENVDPVGVHTGDSIVVAPSQTLSDKQYQMLRNASLKVIRALGVIGGCNIQFALDPHSDRYYIIEVNPRVSRSSALASKATGYPIARMAAKLAIGYHLDELINPITGNTYASFEPAIDYVVVKLPRFPFDKFPEADRSLGTQMKATGETMAIDRTFEGALNKGLRSLELNLAGLLLPRFAEAPDEEIVMHLEQATDLRLFAVAEAFRRGFGMDAIHQYTRIDPWFLHKIQGLVQLEMQLREYAWENVPVELLQEAKKKRVSDKLLATIYGIPEKEVRQRWKELGWKPGYKLVDTCAGEFEAVTPYYYSTWDGLDEAETSSRKKILVIGSGPIRIGQGIEFDYCSVHAALALKKKGYEAIVINNNPETVSTDFSVANRLYFEPITVEDILHVVEKEQPEGVLIQFGGQTAINVAQGLKDAGVRIFGTSLEAIDQLEDREQFYALLKRLDIPHIHGETAHNADELMDAAGRIGFPVLVRPSYVIGGQSMYLFDRPEDLQRYVEQIAQTGDPRLWPVLIDSYVAGLECEVDVISDGKEILVPGIFEHIERAGVHSGDSLAFFPAVTLPEQTKTVIIEYARRIARHLPVVGIMNIQFVVAGERVYVLEVNPRASRTVPIVSKVTGIPMVEWATFVQLGDALSALHDKAGLLPDPGYYSVKAPVFSFNRLKEVDPILGPEMKSTGEILGLGLSKEEALAKVLCTEKGNPFAAGPEKGAILCSVADRQKEESLEVFRELGRRQFRLVATEGTARFLSQHGISVHGVVREIGEIDQAMKSGTIAAVIDIPSQGRIRGKLGFVMRQLAVRYQLPLFTCLDTVKAALNLPGNVSRTTEPVHRYHQMLAKIR